MREGERQQSRGIEKAKEKVKVTREEREEAGGGGEANRWQPGAQM